MKKWRGLTDDEVQEELEQIAIERQLIEDSSFAPADIGTSSGFGGGNKTIKEIADEPEDNQEEDSDLIQE